MGCKSLLELSVFRVCLFARCLTLTGAGDKCSLWQPMELTDSRESQFHIVKVSIFKAHPLQWKWYRTVHMLSKKGLFFLCVSTCCHTQKKSTCFLEKKISIKNFFTPQQWIHNKTIQIWLCSISALISWVYLKCYIGIISTIYTIGHFSHAQKFCIWLCPTVSVPHIYNHASLSTYF